MINAEECKYHSYENGRKNGKDCLKDPSHPCRCMPWLYNYDCENFILNKKENENSDNIILVQYCPLDTTIGRFARSHKDCENFLNEFIEICKASDTYCKYIVIILDDWDCKTPDEIRDACIKTIRNIHNYCIY